METAVVISGQPLKVIIDTGAGASLISKQNRGRRISAPFVPNIGRRYL
jgi:hypothetical protein